LHTVSIRLQMFQACLGVQKLIFSLDEEMFGIQ
jgi:hypothetical protein